MSVDRTEFFLVDPGGILRGKWAPGKAREAIAEAGVAFPLSVAALDVWGREVAATGLHIESGDLDGSCTVVPGSVLPMPWADGRCHQAMLEMRNVDGRPFYGDSRAAARHAAERLGRLGATATVAFELEFYLTDPAAAAAGAVERQSMYDLRALDAFAPLFDDIRRAADIQEIPADTVISEAAPGQFEVNLLHRDDPLRAADDAVCLKRIITGCAARRGLSATFMAKPHAGRPGNGMHLHVSLVTGAGANLFGETEDGAERLEHAVGGLLSTMQEAMLVFANTWNGFRRFAPGSYAPNRLNWGDNNRSVAIRIPAAPPKARRVEHRIAGADANPYLVLALVLAGAAHGLENQVAPPARSEGNAYEGAAPMLESTMAGAIERFAASSFIGEALGPDLQALLTAVKRQECAEFAAHISGFERATYR